MDALTFGTNILLRHLTFSEARKMPVQEFYYDKILQEFEFTREQVMKLPLYLSIRLTNEENFLFKFIDLCILLGCDYCDTIRGIGPKRAFELVSQYKCIEEILKNIDKSKYTVPEDWNYEQARQLFINPVVIDAESIEVSEDIGFHSWKREQKLRSFFFF